jgi:ABC-2 type transport system ATP-binding protein
MQVQAVAGEATDIQPSVRVRGLHKAYGATEAVRGVDFDIAGGEVFGLLGPNGAGKTTIVEILEGYRARTSGEVSVLGFDPGNRDRELRDRIGIVLQETGIEDLLTVREGLNIYGAAYSHQRDTDELLDLVGLEEKADARVETLSGGQKRRLDLALGLVGDPDLIFLDEPTTGFDPTARRRSWDLIGRLRSLGKTVLLTTHYMEEAQQLADRVAVIAAGRIVAEGSPDSLTGRADAPALISFHEPSGLGELPLPDGADVERSDGRISFHTTTPTRDLAPLLGHAAAAGVELDGLSITRPSLEDVYIELTREPETAPEAPTS